MERRNKEQLYQKTPKFKDINYHFEQLPDWYIRGSYVLDKIFFGEEAEGKGYALDVDVFIREDLWPPEIKGCDKLPKIKTSKPIDFVKLSGEEFIPSTKPSHLA